MAAGYDLTAQDLRNRLSQTTAGLRTALAQTRDLLQRLADIGPTTIQAAYVASYGIATTQAQVDAHAAMAAQDYADLQAAQAAMTDVITFATYAAPSGAVTRTDNTIGTVDETVTVPHGAYAVVSSDPAVVALLKSVGADKGPAIRKPSPLGM